MIHVYLMHIMIIVGIYIILAVSLNLALGFTGLLNLGHVAFFGIGAYASALLTKAGVPFLAAFIIAGLIAGLSGFLLVIATKKLKGDYLALATLGFSFVVYSLLLNWTSLTRGALGMPGIARPSFFGISLASNFAYLIFVIVVCIASVFLVSRVAKSPFGRLLQALRDDETGLMVLGKNTFHLKYKAMVISAFFAGIAGSLLAHYITYIDPYSFYLSEIILILTIVIVGGIASVKGSVAATFVILIVPEALRFVALPSTVVGPARQIIYALILILILLFRPRGIFGRVDISDA